MSIRMKIRNNEYRKSTAGLLEEYVQVNVALIPSELADEFETFSKLNPKACPLIERSDDFNFTEIGPVDIKRDIPKYNVFENGQYIESVLDLTAYDLEDYSAFAVGCSFTFEQGLIFAGIAMKHIDEGKNVAMYDTNHACTSTEHFSGHMVVSMRPIKKNQLDEVIRITSKYSRTHGIPIHIGDPKVLGIESLSSPDYGDAIEISDDEVPVFWPCGVTNENILKHSIKDRFYTHAPGHMLITHLKTSDVILNDLEEHLNGMLLRGTYERKMTGGTFVNDIGKMAKSLLEFDHITLITGFCIRSAMAGETDGPLGTGLLARALELLGKTVRIVTDEYSYEQVLCSKTLFSLNCGVTTSLDIVDTDLVFAIERPGKHLDGHCYSMKGKELTDLVSDTDLLIQAYINKEIPFYAIGDGGNEVGMGKIKSYIHDFVPNGEKICAELSADQLLVAGVSNWGCNVLIAMLSYISGKLVLHNLKEELAVLECMVSKGSVDGVTGKNELSIDGYDLNENQAFLNELHKILEENT